MEKPELAPLDQLARQFSFEPPRAKGMHTVETFASALTSPAPHRSAGRRQVGFQTVLHRVNGRLLLAIQ
jgi:hypothetical protein